MHVCNEKTFEKEVIKEPKLMEMSSNENQDISILFEDESLIVDKKGRILNRFNTSGGVHPIRMRLKNKVSFLIPNIDKSYVDVFIQLEYRRYGFI